MIIIRVLLIKTKSNKWETVHRVEFVSLRLQIQLDVLFFAYLISFRFTDANTFRFRTSFVPGAMAHSELTNWRETMLSYFFSNCNSFCLLNLIQNIKLTSPPSTSVLCRTAKWLDWHFKCVPILSSSRLEYLPRTRSFQMNLKLQHAYSFFKVK